MNPPIHCEGAPRDLGFDQGLASRAALQAVFGRGSFRERLARQLGGLEAPGARIARDVARYFPRQAEALDGLSRGARVPRAWLATRLAEAARDPSRLGEGPGAAATSGRAAALLALAAPPGWLLRHSRPEGGIACLELAPPWFTGAVAAVSEAGLAAAVVCHGAARGSCAAPAALLVQDALHRTESLAGALDWCLRRPAGGRATLLFADAAGEVGGLRVEGDARQVLRPANGLLVAASGPARVSEVVKALSRGGRPQAADLAAALGGAVVLDPGSRSLAHHPGAGRPVETRTLAD